MGRSKETVLGIDIGGTKIRFIYAGKFREYPTPKNKKDFIKLIKGFPEADKIGIAVAGVSHGPGVAFAPNIKYLKNFDFRQFGWKMNKFKVNNDARAFIRAEAGNRKNILGITIGTGIGRAISGKRIKSFEHPVKWEKEYQKIRDKKEVTKLAEFLSEKINSIAQKRKPRLIILGGGVLHRKGLLEMLQKGIKTKVERAKLLPKSGAIGAAMLWD